MGKFVKKLLIYFLILGVIIGGLNFWYVRTKDHGYEDKFYSVPMQIKYFNLGSSHGLCDFCYDSLQEEAQCFNFGMNSQTLSYDYRLLQQYDENLTEGGVCFIIISYFSFFEDEENRDNFEVKNARYYRFLEPKYIKQYNPEVDICVRYLPVLSSNEDIFSILLKKPSNRNQFELDWQRITSAKEADENAENAIERHIISYKNEGIWTANQEEVDALKNIIMFCHERNIKAVMITPPYLREYNERVPEEFKDYFMEIVNHISDEYGVEYYDYSADGRFQTEYDLFMNADHLNKEGAAEFTQIVWDEIVK